MPLLVPLYALWVFKVLIRHQGREVKIIFDRAFVVEQNLYYFLSFLKAQSFFADFDLKDLNLF